MPFGIRSTSEYIEKHRALMLDERTSNCHCCNKEMVPGDKGLVPVVPARFAYLIDGEDHERRALLCSNCYTKQRTLKFNTLEDLILHIGTKQRLPRTPKVRDKPAAKSVVRRTKTSLKNIDREFLVELHRMLGEFLAQGDSDVVPEDEDDLLAGMTDEQRAKMDAAVIIAAARTTEVPREEWNNNDGLPTGW